MGAAAAAGMAQAAISLTSAFIQNEASRSQDRFQRSMANLRADSFDRQAEERIREGETDAARIATQTGSIIGSQRAAYVGQGVAPDSGTAGLIQDETRLTGQMDEAQTRINAYREAFGYKTEAILTRSESRMQSQQARFGRRMTLLTAGLNAVASVGPGMIKSPQGKFVPRNPTEDRFNQGYR